MRDRGAVAAIDCGTNSTRLLVSDGAGRTVERAMEITRLGRGVDATGKLSTEAVDRCVNVLRGFRQVMDRTGVERARLVATSAVRDAGNGGEFLAAAAEATGVVPELLSGEEEGRLSMAGSLSELHPSDGPFLVLDIGGGSTEMVTGTGPDDPHPSVVSLQQGCVRVTERWLLSDPPGAGELAAARASIGADLEAAVGAHPRLMAARCLVGLAGTVSTLSSLNSGLTVYDRDRVHHSVLEAASVLHWYRVLASEDRQARVVRPGMVRGREDVIVGGALILSTVMGRLGFDRCLVSESDILDGLVASLR